MQIKKALRAVAGALTAAAVAAGSVPAFAYQNPITIDNQWTSKSGMHYGIGDPFVMKYNGTYYMYVTTVSGQYGLRVWSSDDLVNWSYRGSCVSEEDAESWRLTNGTYAPEVVYWNGMFYLYSSSNDQYHKTFTSKSPLGPFVFRNETVDGRGDGIDGSVFIDDDANATKYFLHSGSPAIEYGVLSDNLLKASGKTRIDAASVTGKWTEGPSIFKRNGKYYMTYTGNHCQADSYMIEYAAANTITPGSTDFKEPTDNRILINTDDGITGLGHNSVVVGPDLDSRYIVYHNLVGTMSTERQMDIDRIVFNNEKLEVQGPTWWSVPDPKLPDFSDRMENADKWETLSGAPAAADGFMTLSGSAETVSKSETGDDYTAEFNLAVSGGAAGSRAGAIVSYKDKNNCAYVLFDPENNSVNLSVIKNGVSSALKTASLPADYVYNADTLKKLTVKKQSGKFDIYADDRLVISGADANGLTGGKIGFKTENCSLRAGYTAFSSTVNGNEDKSSLKPTGSAMDAVHANETSRQFETGTFTETGAGLKSDYYKNLTVNDSLTYKIAAQDTSNYSADIVAKSAAGAKIKIEVDGKTAAENLQIPASEEFKTTAFRNIPVSCDSSDVKITVTEGALDLYSVKLCRLDDVYEKTVTQDMMNFEQLEGYWTDDVNKLSATNGSVWSKCSYGTEYMGDYELSADIKLKTGGDAGLLVRLKYATPASDKDNPIGDCKNTDYHQGYYVYLNTEGIHLGKQVFGWKVLAHANQPLSMNKAYNVKVRCEGDNIRVLLDGVEVINCTDLESPLMEGKIGARAMNATADFENVTLTHLNPAPPINEQVKLNEGAVPLLKQTVKAYSNIPVKGFKFTDGGVKTSDSRMSVKGYLKDVKLLNGAVSCDITMQEEGYFGAGILLRNKLSSFGNPVDSLDGVEVQLERGAGRNLVVNVPSWVNKAYKGNVASATIENFFPERGSVTANIKALFSGSALFVYLNGEQVLKADIGKWEAGSDRAAIGYRIHRSSKLTLTNFTFSEEKIPVTGVMIDKAQTEQPLKVGQTVSLSAFVAPEYATDKSVVWSADNDNVTVDEAGVVTAKKAGAAVVTAKTADGGFTDSVTLQILPEDKPEIKESVRINSKNITLTHGKSKTITATAAIANAKITWSTSNAKVAAVVNGKITAKGVGTAKITAKSGNASASITVKVNPKKIKKFAAKKNGRKVTFKITKADKKYSTRIQYRKAGAKKYKTLKTTKAKSFAKKFKKGNYQFRACSYVNGYSSAYSKAVKVKIK